MSLEQRIAASVLADHWYKERAASTYPDQLAADFGPERCEAALTEIKQWSGYQPSKLASLSPLARALGLAEVRYKDESGRFGLGSFKALGGAFAVLRYLSNQLGVPMQAIRAGAHKAQAANVTVSTATDGNHGRSVAWGAQSAGCQCKIYIHRHVSTGRQQAMEKYGAEVIRVDGDYDETVRVCAAQSAERGWQVISDTSYEDYYDIPRDVMAGYSVIASEIVAAMDLLPTHLIIQAGVGGLASGVIAKLWMDLGQAMPKTILVESERAACFIASLRENRPVNVPVIEETVMAGLSCGEPSIVAFDIIKEAADAAVTIADGHVAPMMKAMADGIIAGEPIEAGECAVPGIIALCGIVKDAALALQLGITAESRVVLIGCEGATDPEIYRQLLEQGA